MDDWQVGDLALCVDDREWPGEIFALWNVTVGGLYRVTNVDHSSDEVPLLNLAEDPFACDDYGWDCRRFRKITALTVEERDSFLADLDEPITPARRVAPVDAALNARVGHLSPLACPASSLPGPSAVNTPCHADGSGLLFNRAHDAEVSNG